MRYKDPTGHMSVGEAFGIVSKTLGDVGNALGIGDGGSSGSGYDTSNNPQANNLRNSKDSGSKRISQRPEVPLQQYDKSINVGEDKNMKKAGCYFMSIKNQAERAANKNMTSDEINSVRVKTQSGKNPAVQQNMRVRRPNDVGNESLKKLGISDKEMVVGGPSRKGDQRSGTILKGKAYNLQGKPYLTKSGKQMYHFKSGDANGNEVYNPAKNIITKDDEVFADVYLRDKAKEK